MILDSLLLLGADYIDENISNKKKKDNIRCVKVSHASINYTLYSRDKNCAIMLIVLWRTDLIKPMYLHASLQGL